VKDLRLDILDSEDKLDIATENDQDTTGIMKELKKLKNDLTIVEDDTEDLVVTLEKDEKKKKK